MSKKMGMVRARRGEHIAQEFEERGFVSLGFREVTDLPKEEGRHFSPSLGDREAIQAHEAAWVRVQL